MLDFVKLDILTVNIGSRHHMH